MKLRHEQKDVSKLINEFRLRTESCSFKAEKLIFNGIGNFDVYNITAPIKINNKIIIAGRVEKRDSEHAKIKFFERVGDSYVLIKGTPCLELQDPAISIIGDELVLSGVKIFDHPFNKGRLWWKTVFYRGKDIFSLRKFSEGPNGMKDIRLVDLDTKVGIFTRPQNAAGKLDSDGGRGAIAYTEIDCLNDLCVQKINQAKILENQLLNEQWLGANEIHVLDNSLLGVLGHVAMFDNKMDRHYFPATFVFDRLSQTYSSVKIIAERSMFKEGPSKKPDLKDVVFSGGLIRKSNKKAELYVGTGDTEAQKIEINDPFVEYELV